MTQLWSFVVERLGQGAIENIQQEKLEKAPIRCNVNGKWILSSVQAPICPEHGIMTCRVVEIHTAIIQNWRFSRQGAEILKMLPWKSNNGFPHYCWSDTNYCAHCIIELIPTQLSEQRNTIHRQKVAVNNILKNLPCKRNSYFSVYCSATMTLYRNNAAGNNKMY
jgi:hypothetical protein